MAAGNERDNGLDSLLQAVDHPDKFIYNFFRAHDGYTADDLDGQFIALYGSFPQGDTLSAAMLVDEEITGQDKPSGPPAIEQVIEQVNLGLRSLKRHRDNGLQWPSEVPGRATWRCVRQGYTVLSGIEVRRVARSGEMVPVYFHAKPLGDVELDLEEAGEAEPAQDFEPGSIIAQLKRAIGIDIGSLLLPEVVGGPIRPIN